MTILASYALTVRAPWEQAKEIVRWIAVQTLPNRDFTITDYPQFPKPIMKFWFLIAIQYNISDFEVINTIRKLYREGRIDD